MVMVATICTALGCREVALPDPPMHPAVCQMRVVTMQAFVAVRVAALGADLRDLRCVTGVPV